MKKNRPNMLKKLDEACARRGVAITGKTNRERTASARRVRAKIGMIHMLGHEEL